MDLVMSSCSERVLQEGLYPNPNIIPTVLSCIKNILFKLAELPPKNYTIINL